MDPQLLSTLESQHRQAEDLLAQLENATEEAEQRSLAEKLASALTEHMTIEEEQVYPELQRIDGEMAEEAEIEHGLAREGLSKLQSLVGQPGFGAAVAMVQAGIAHHVEEEENEAFPKLREALGLGDGGGSNSGDGSPTKEELYEKAKEAGVEGRSSMTKEQLADAVSEAQSR